MESNKFEAKKAMDIAERKLSENDFNGAKKFVEKAQNLYPNLDGLEQMSMIIHVFISASNKINVGGGEESDWYGILSVDPLADEEAVKKQYKKLALLLHPDKNNFKGAEEAFKLVLEAYSVLSDKVERIAFDQRRKSNEVKTEMQTPPNQHKPAASSNMNQNASPGPGPGPGRKPHFWTLCSGCQSLCEYLRDRYLNKAVRCPNCDQTFFATESNLWGYIMMEVDLRLSLLRRKEQQQQWSAPKKETNRNTNGASYSSASGTTQEPSNAYKPASSNWNQSASHGVDPNAYTTSNNHAPPPPSAPGPGPAPVYSSKQSRGGYFWTLCSGCQSLCEYLRDYYLNRATRCPNCDQTFFATENNYWGNIMMEVDSKLSFLRQQQQWSAQNTSGATYYHTSSSASFHRNLSASVIEILDEAIAAAEQRGFLRS